MTLEEIEQYLVDHDIELTADKIDMIDQIYSIGFGDGHKAGFNRGLRENSEK